MFSLSWELVQRPGGGRLLFIGGAAASNSFGISACQEEGDALNRLWTSLVLRHGRALGLESASWDRRLTGPLTGCETRVRHPLPLKRSPLGHGSNHFCSAYSPKQKSKSKCLVNHGKDETGVPLPLEVGWGPLPRDLTPGLQAQCLDPCPEWSKPTIGSLEQKHISGGAGWWS